MHLNNKYIEKWHYLKSDSLKNKINELSLLENIKEEHDKKNIAKSLWQIFEQEENLLLKAKILVSLGRLKVKSIVPNILNYINNLDSKSSINANLIIDDGKNIAWQLQAIDAIYNIRPLNIINICDQLLAKPQMLIKRAAIDILGEIKGLKACQVLAKYIIKPDSSYIRDQIWMQAWQKASSKIAPVDQEKFTALLENPNLAIWLKYRQWYDAEELICITKNIIYPAPDYLLNYFLEQGFKSQEFKMIYWHYRKKRKNFKYKN